MDWTGLAVHMFGGAICADLTKISKNLVTWLSRITWLVWRLVYEGHCFMMMLGLIELVDVFSFFLFILVGCCLFLVFFSVCLSISVVVILFGCLVA